MTDQSKQQPTDATPEIVADTTVEDAQDAALAAVEDAAAESVAGKPDAAKEEQEERKIEYERDPREDIEEAIAAKQAAPVKEEESDVDKPDEEGDEPAPVEASDEKSPAPQSNDDDPIIKVKVDGVEREVRQSQIIANYQKGEAAEKRLQEATELLKQVKAATATDDRSTLPAGPDQQDPDDDSTKTADDKARLASIAEKLQLGDTEEAVAALQEIIKEAQKGTNPQDLDDRIRTTTSVERERAESEKALNAFMTENAVLKENQRLARELAYEVGTQMREDIRSVLRAEGHQEADIKRVDSFSNEQLKEVHRLYRANGLGVRDTTSILSTAKETLAKDGFWPAAAKNVNRTARKEQTAQQQPAPQSHQTPIPGKDGKQTKPQTTAEIVAEENRERGLPTV